MTDTDAARYRQAAELFAAQVDRVRDDQWALPTPCAEWDVRALVNHVTTEMLWAPDVLAGRTLAEVGDRFAGDQLGTDPKRACEDALALALIAFLTPKALDGTVHLSYGDDSAVNYSHQMTLDAFVHAWDLAQGCGVNLKLPSDLVAWALGTVGPVREMVTASGLFGTPREVQDGASDQTRLLAWLGRDNPT